MLKPPFMLRSVCKSCSELGPKKTGCSIQRRYSLCSSLYTSVALSSQGLRALYQRAKQQRRWRKAQSVELGGLHGC